jgi:hypothetical protein
MLERCIVSFLAQHIVTKIENICRAGFKPLRAYRVYFLKDLSTYILLIVFEGILCVIRDGGLAPQDPTPNCANEHTYTNYKP